MTGNLSLAASPRDPSLFDVMIAFVFVAFSEACIQGDKTSASTSRVGARCANMNTAAAAVAAAQEKEEQLSPTCCCTPSMP